MAAVAGRLVPRPSGWLVLAAFWASTACAAEAGAQPPLYRVERVVDGDTLVVATIGTVRLIGVDSPEMSDERSLARRLAHDATGFLRTMVAGKPVRLEYDGPRVDSYGRTLAYVFLPDDTLVNLEIVREGFGHAYLQFPFRRIDRFRAAEREARDARRGLWADDVIRDPRTGRPTKVWLNVASRVYHCPGSPQYGKTARGVYRTEAEARNEGHRPAGGRACGP